MRPIQTFCRLFTTLLLMFFNVCSFSTFPIRYEADYHQWIEKFARSQNDAFVIC